MFYLFLFYSCFICSCFNLNLFNYVLFASFYSLIVINYSMHSINTKLFQPSIWDDFPMKRNNQLIDTIIQPEFELDLPERIKLPKGFQIIQLSLESHLERIRDFLNNHYSLSLNSTNSIVYSSEYIEWLFTCPKKHFKKFKSSTNDNWLVGVEDINSGELYGFISARPIQYFIDDRYCNAMIIDRMCVKTDARSKRLSVVLMKEIYRRMKHIENECMALFCTNANLPFQPISTTSQLLIRNISFHLSSNSNSSSSSNSSSNPSSNSSSNPSNSNKHNSTSDPSNPDSNNHNLNELIAKRDQETDTSIIKDLNNQIDQLNSLKIEPTQDIHQIRLANKRDIDELMTIYNKYNQFQSNQFQSNHPNPLNHPSQQPIQQPNQKHFRTYRCYNKKEFEHIFLPRKDMIYTYVLTNSQGSIKDFVSTHIFYTNQGQKLAFIYYISFINDKLLEIFMKNILYILKESEVDHVIAHEWTGLTPTLNELHFNTLNSNVLNSSNSNKYAWYIFNYNTKTININECNLNVFL